MYVRYVLSLVFFVKVKCIDADVRLGRLRMEKCWTFGHYETVIVIFYTCKLGRQRHGSHQRRPLVETATYVRCRLRRAAEMRTAFY